MGLTDRLPAKARVGAGLAPTRYRTQWCRPGSSVWVAGPDLELGFVWSPQHTVQTSVVLNGASCDEECSLTVNDDRALVLDVNRSQAASLICALEPDAFIRCSAVVTLDGTHFTGKVTQLCDGQPVDLPWKGEWTATF